MWSRSFRSIVTVMSLSLPASACVAATALAPSPAPAQPAPKVSSISDIKRMLVDTLPADAKEIADAVKTAKVGDTLTVRGTIPAGPNAFNADAAEFTLARPAPASPGGASAPQAAPTPAAAVRVANDKGETLKGSLSGKHALKGGAEVFVTGVVEAVAPDRITLRAASMHIPRSPLPETFFSDASIDNARDVSEARKAGALKVGDEVVLRGRIGGSKSPFVAGRAVFTLMGRGLKACSENPGDACKVPWDYCCETRADILANSVTVQVIDDNGQSLRTDMKGRRGLKELSEVVIVGKVGVADSKAVVVNATRMYVMP